MQVLPVQTPLLGIGNSLTESIRKKSSARDGDVIVVSSKVVAVTEGAAIALHALQVSEDAARYAERCQRNSAFCEAVLQETARLNGRVIGTCKGAMLTELQPSGMKTGALLVPNAGLDESNIAHGYAVGWPHDPVASLERLHTALGRDVAWIMTDSCCMPCRTGVIAFAMACHHMDPVRSEIGNNDLFGNTMQITVEALADQLAIAGNSVMGNAAQSTPAAVIRDHGIPFTSFSGWVNGIDPKNDLFKDMFKEIA